MKSHRNPIVYHGSPDEITDLLKLSGKVGLGAEYQIPGIYFTDSIEFARFFATEPKRTTAGIITIKKPTITIVDIRPRKILDMNNPAPKDFRQMIIQSAIENGAEKDQIEEIEEHLNNDSMNSLIFGTDADYALYEEEELGFFAKDLKVLGYDCIMFMSLGSRLGLKDEKDDHFSRHYTDQITNYIVLDASIITQIETVVVPAPLKSTTILWPEL